MPERSAVRTALVPTLILLATSDPAWSATAKQQNPSGVLLLALLLPLFLLVFLALELVLWVVAPAPLDAARDAIERGRGRCLAMGLIAGLAVFVLLAIAGQVPVIGKTLAPVLLGIVALALLAGLSAVVELLGEGAIQMSGRAGTRALAVIVGSLLLGLVILFPIVGQALGAYFLLVGLGGVVMALVDASQKKK